LCEYVEHVVALGKALSPLNPLLIHGNLRPARNRDAALSRFRTETPAVTIATLALAGEGLSAALLDTLVLASPNNNRSRTAQAVGRVVRSSPGKSSALIVDFVDVRVPRLQHYARTRTRAYEALS
jgi:superfamily II DNA or RNA helicase